MSFEKIVYSNPFRNGDTHVSRSFIREIMKKFPDKRHEYYHTDLASPLVLSDIDNLHIKIGNIDTSKGVYYDNGTVYISTWYASCNYKYFISGCSIQTLYNYLKTEVNKCFTQEVINNDILNYLPVIDFNKIDAEVKNKISLLRQKYKKIIMICDNVAMSGQGIDVNFNDFTCLIKNNKDCLFVSTNNNMINYGYENLIYFQSICNKPFNLLECSYLSTFSEVIIGRNSGPQTFSLIKDNILNPNKSIITFCNLEIYDFGISILPTDKKCRTINFKTINPDVISKLNEAITK